MFRSIQQRNPPGHRRSCRDGILIVFARQLSFEVSRYFPVPNRHPRLGFAELQFIIFASLFGNNRIHLLHYRANTYNYYDNKFDVIYQSDVSAFGKNSNSYLKLEFHKDSFFAQENNTSTPVTTLTDGTHHIYHQISRTGEYYDFKLEILYDGNPFYESITVYQFDSSSGQSTTYDSYELHQVYEKYQMRHVILIPVANKSDTNTYLYFCSYDNSEIKVSSISQASVATKKNIKIENNS